jgi:hypothetical protein
MLLTTAEDERAIGKSSYRNTFRPIRSLIEKSSGKMLARIWADRVEFVLKDLEMAIINGR